MIDSVDQAALHI